MNLSILASVALFAGMSSASATENIYCQALDGSEAFIEMNVGGVALEQPTWVRLGFDDEFWSSIGDEGSNLAVLIGQAFFDAGEVSVDVTDDQSGTLLASLRVLRAEEAEERHQFGYLHIHGRGIFPVQCTGP